MQVQECPIFSLSVTCEWLFALVYFPLDLSCGVCNVLSLYVLCCSVNGSVCLCGACLDSVCELFDNTIRNMFVCGCYFVVEYYGVL